MSTKTRAIIRGGKYVVFSIENMANIVQIFGYPLKADFRIPEPLLKLGEFHT